MTITEQRLIQLLCIIKDMALLPYPFREDETADPRIVLALGQIAGIAMKVLSEKEDE